MNIQSSTPHPSLGLRAARSDEADVYEAVKLITRTAFLINPETGLRIEGDTPTELPMVEALFARGAVDHLHVATLEGEVVAYVLYSRGAVTNNPNVHVQGLTIMGVRPEQQRQGIGTQLLAWSVAKLRGVCDALFVVGHPEFYARAGFVEASELGIEFSFPAPSEVCRIAVLGEQALAPGVASYHPVVHEFF